MDSLKLIPSVFFDGIARVIPGTAAIFAYFLLSDSTWSQLLEKTLGQQFASSGGPLTAIIVLLIAAYVAGQLIAPFAKLMQRIGEWNCFHPKPKADSRAYDFLRLHYKEAGSQCAKIRAEFTMFNGLAVVFLASAACYPLASLGWSCTTLAILIGMALATPIRGRTTRDTFNETVTKFASATTFPEPPNKSHQEGPG